MADIIESTSEIKVNMAQGVLPSTSGNRLLVRALRARVYLFRFPMISQHTRENDSRRRITNWSAEIIQFKVQ